MRKGEKKRKRGLANAVRGKTRRLTSARPAAAPASQAHTPHERTSLIPDTQTPRRSEDWLEEPKMDELVNLPPVMLIITILALLFIGLIAWLVAQMPAK